MLPAWRSLVIRASVSDEAGEGIARIASHSHFAPYEAIVRRNGGYDDKGKLSPAR